MQGSLCVKEVLKMTLVPSLREVLKIDRRWHICARAATCLGKFQKLTPGGIYLLLVGLFWVLEVLKFDTRWLIHVLGLLCAWKVLKIDTRWLIYVLGLLCAW